MSIEITKETNVLIQSANKIYSDNFDGKTWFGRCIFLSWYCDVGTCKFCYRSTQKSRIKHSSHAKRSVSSIIVEVLLSKRLGWRIEFLTGGYKIFPFDQLVRITKIVSSVYGEKIWLNLGALEEKDLIAFKPYVKGIVASIETVNKELHDDICPNKPIEPYEKMFELCDSCDSLKDADFRKSMTMVVGLGEKKEQFEELKEFISKFDIERITFYALKPVSGTPYEHGPTTEEYFWWIAKTRIAFPKLQIIAGTTARRVDEIKQVLLAGANAITKFPATKQYATENAKILEKNVLLAGREFTSTLTNQKLLVDWDWRKEIDELTCDEIDSDLKKEVKEKMELYLKRMI